ncbi:MAG: Lysyl-lysine 2,3-aminomutase [uncultured Thiotrichaceae bacterium]|uniref:L-lysine 2,3-aminomutase n=1 Tax=uncultured Thiotrichaceae bacterium TaxID=298394 RepID=A0A6S6SJM6_9GAMM|nr:MAG: Lysyl-lysine 2,3-aminomutase [uncultured Thiotrichaceae bacterium]
MKKTTSTHWQQELTTAIKKVEELCDFLKLDITKAPYPISTHQRFPLKLTQHYVNNIQKGDWNDPLLLQVLPSSQENIQSAGFHDDPVGDLQAVDEPGILKKYHGRALLITTQACPVHCRYCFRREFPYSNNHASKRDWGTTIENVRNDKTLNEVILSGGDPLSLSDKKIKSLIKQLENIPHIKTLRIHSRYPLLLPSRLSTELLEILTNNRFRVILVIHANHANELDDVVQQQLQHYHAAGIMLLNQSVLLKGINDEAKTLIALSHRLMDCHVLPYYLHQLDKVTGTRHFEVTDTQALALISTLREALPGYLVPRLVREVSGKRSKTPIV